MGRPGKKFGHEIGGVGRKVRIGTDLLRDGQNLFGWALKNKKILQKIPGDHMGQTRLLEAYIGVKIRSWSMWRHWCERNGTVGVVNTFFDVLWLHRHEKYIYLQLDRNSRISLLPILLPGGIETPYCCCQRLTASVITS